MKRILALITILAFTVFGSITASAKYIIGSEYGASAMYQIDSTTGEFVTLGTPDTSRLPGLAYNPTTDTLYGTDESNLYTVDKSSGATTLVGSHGFSVTGLTFNDSYTLLYAIGYDRNLYSINPATGAALVIGAFGIGTTNLYDLATDGSGTVYGAGSGSNVYTINTTTGAATLVGARTGITSSVTSITFSDSDTLFAIDIGSDRLLNIDTVTLVTTEIGTAKIGSDVRGLAYIGEARQALPSEPVPTMSALAILALALVMALTGWVAIKD